MAEKIITIEGYIGPSGFSKQFVRNELAGNTNNTIRVNISSLGGSVDDAISIHNQFIEHGNVTAFLSAFVASAATIISLGAREIKMFSNSFYLIHKASNFIDEWGSMNEDDIQSLIDKLEAKKQELAKISLQLAKMYVNRSGKSLNEIIELMKKQAWLTAQEAKEWGFVDEIIEPVNAENFLENHQMVALINSNDYPPLPRKSQQQQTNSTDEETLFSKIWNRFTNKQSELTLKTTIMKNQFLLVNQALKVEKLESSEEGVFLNEEQLQLIEDSLSANHQLVTERDAALADVQSVNSQLSNSRTELSEAINLFNAIDSSVLNAKTTDEKVQAIRTLLAAKPSSNPVGNQDENTPPADEVEWDIINNLPHNKLVDNNL